MVSKKDKAKKGKPNCGTTAPDLSNNATSSSSEVETHKSNDLSNVQSDFGLLQLNQNPNQLLCLSTPSVVSSEGTFYTPMHTAMNTPRNTPVGSPVKSDDSSDGDFLTAVEELDIEPLELTSPFGSPKKEVVPEAADPLFSKAPADEDCSATLVTNDKASSCLGTPTSGDDTTPTKQKKPENSSRCPLQGSTSLSQHHSHLHLQISESSSTSVLLEDPLSTAEVKVSTRTIGTQTEDEPVIAVETHESPSRPASRISTESGRTVETDSVHEESSRPGSRSSDCSVQSFDMEQPSEGSSKPTLGVSNESDKNAIDKSESTNDPAQLSTSVLTANSARGPGRVSNGKKGKKKAKGKGKKTEAQAQASLSAATHSSDHGAATLLSGYGSPFQVEGVTQPIHGGLSQPGQSINVQAPMANKGVGTGSIDATGSNLRATAVAFIPDNAKPRPGDMVDHHRNLANRVRDLVGPPDIEMMQPNCPPKDTQNHLMFVYPFYGEDAAFAHPAFSQEQDTPVMDYIKGMNLSYTWREPWHKTAYRAPDDNPDTLATENYKVQIPDRRSCPMSAPLQAAVVGPVLTPEELKRRDDKWRKTILDAHLAEEKRTPADIEKWGAGYYPHMMATHRPLTEDMWVRGIGPGHRYQGRCTTPNPRGQEWWEIAQAIKNLNLEYLDREVRRSTQFEPPIPTGYGARANFNQPGRQQPVRKAALRGGGAVDEWDWIQTPIEGCRYCGDDRHETFGCDLMQLHRDNAIIQCLNCQGSGHFLRDCMSLPKFNNLDGRARKLQVYAHTEHWRKTLHEQHTKFAALRGVKNYPPLKSGTGDPSIVFSWLECPNCTPETHWDRFVDAANNARHHYGSLKEHQGDPRRYWEHALWVFVYDVCPVIWSVMHQSNPDLVLHFINPLASVAVDAFWRTTMKAMGWDAPNLPDGSSS